MLRVLIVDDETLAGERLVHLCRRLGDVEVVGVVCDGRAAQSEIEALAPEVVLLDISMPVLDGMALARMLAARDDRPAIVFVTAHGCYAVKAFEIAATDYLLKPVSLQRLGQAFARAREARARRPVAASSGYLAEIWVPRGREMTRVGVDTLDLVEAERDYVRLHAKGQVFLLRTTLRELESRLDPDQFLRVHRSTIVSRDRIQALRSDAGEWSVLLSTGQTIRVGRSFRSQVRKLTEARP